MKYNIYEIFYSIQGEGHHTGMAAIFIRFSGCNLDCDFCDEKAKYEAGKILSLEEIKNELDKYKECKNIILTGGEPALQIDDNFISFLKKNEYKIHIETNGTKELPKGIDWITVSPKTKDFIKGDELKLVYNEQDIILYEKKVFKYYYLQAKSNENIDECIEIVKKNPKWRLSLQIHKFINIK